MSNPYRRLRLPGIMLFVVTAGARAQSTAPTISVGDGTFDGRRLVPYANAWLLRQHYPDGHTEDRGIWSDILRPDTLGGRPVMVRTQGMTYRKGIMTATLNVFDPVSMAPLRGELRAARPGRSRLQTRVFDGTRVTTTITGNGPDSSRTTGIPGPVFDFNGGMYGLFFATLPLRSGLVGTLPSLGEFTDDYQLVSFRVLRQERVRAGRGGDIPTWVIEVGDPVSLRFWISPDPPYIIRLEVPGAGGSFTYDMIP